METKDIVTIIALILGPVIAVIITRWSQKRSEKRNAKWQLFLTLMATAGWAQSRVGECAQPYRRNLCGRDQGRSTMAPTL